MIKRLRTTLYVIYIRLKERRYNNARYLLVKPKFGRKYIEEYRGGKVLIISFAGFSPDCARYNYINTLKDVNCYRLFVLDDHGFEKRGSYYLDTIEEQGVSQSVLKLIFRIREKYDIQRVITVGSSKGGSCALMFGLKIGADACVIGAPQYFIGDYLNIPEHIELLKAMIGNATEDKISDLNEKIFNELKDGDRETEIFLHYSKYENTYKAQIVDLLNDLNTLGYSRLYLDDDYDYLSHADVAKYFPSFLNRTCKLLIGDVK